MQRKRIRKPRPQRRGDDVPSDDLTERLRGLRKRVERIREGFRKMIEEIDEALDVES